VARGVATTPRVVAREKADTDLGTSTVASYIDFAGGLGCQKPAMASSSCDPTSS